MHTILQTAVGSVVTAIPIQRLPRAEKGDATSAIPAVNCATSALAPTRLEIIKKLEHLTGQRRHHIYLSQSHTPCIIIILILQVISPQIHVHHVSSFHISFPSPTRYHWSSLYPPILIRSTHCHTPINQYTHHTIHPSIGRFRFSHKFITYHHRHWDFSFVYQYLILSHEHLFCIFYLSSLMLVDIPLLTLSCIHIFICIHTQVRKMAWVSLFGILFLIWWALRLGCITISFAVCLPNSNEIQIL